jgi:hypothetical protein
VKPGDRPPLWFWLIPTVVAGLRMLPRISLGSAPAPEGKTFLGVSYLPKDFLQYAAFIRQVAEDGSFFFYDPFTTDPQSSRFVLLFHWLVGVVARIGDFSAIDALEWSRVPLVFVFFATLWWFLRPFLPDRKDRLAAALLIGFASGIDAWLRPLAPQLPEEFRERFLQDTSGLHGWSVFASCYNPLWIAAQSAALLVLRPLLVGGEKSLHQLALTSAGLLFLYGIHPYATIGVLGIVAVQPVVTLLSRARPDWRRHLADAAALGSALLVIGALNLWQLQDPVYHASVGGIFGPQNLSVLWYPITLGLLGWLGVVGARRWIAARHPQRLAIFGWILAVAVLHWLPILNGYKFVFLLPLPVCILAAPVAREVFGRICGPDAPGRWLALGAGIALFGGVVFQTVEDVRSTRAVSATPSDLMSVVQTLSELPAGNALVPSGVGNVLPAFSPHRVWVGHWFLTPDYYERHETFRRLISNRSAAPELRKLVHEQQIRYLVVPSARYELVAEALGQAVGERLPHGELELLVLR